MGNFKVYRIEHKKWGVGPYNCATEFDYDFIDEMKSKHSDIKTHPNLIYDNLEEYRASGLCGCLTIDKLKNWFGKFFDELLKTTEFIVVEYIVKEYKEGEIKKQVAFYESDIISKSVFPLFN